MASPVAVLNILLTANTTQATAALAKSQAQLQATGATATKAGDLTKKALAGVTLAAGATAVALFKVGEEFDKSYDTIRTRTGATGREMQKLKQSFRDVVGSTPVDFDTAAKAVGGLGQRLDITGKPLSRITKQLTSLAKLTGEDIDRTVTATTRLFGDWSISTKEQSTRLDELFRLSQKTGIGINDLMELLVQFGSPLRQLGFSFEESAAMFARFEREGVNMQTLLPGLRMALKNLSVPTTDLAALMKRLGVEGGSAREKLFDVFETVSSSKVKEADRTLLASSVFGGRAWADMKAAVEEGRFEFDELIRQMQKGDSTIRGTERATRDLSEHWQVFANNLKLFVEPIATRVFKGLGDLMKEVTSAFRREGLQGVLDLMAQKLSEAAPKIAQAGGKIGVALAKGLFEAFMNAPEWVKLLAGAWLVRRMMGSALFGSAATTMGAKFGGLFASSAVAALTIGVLQGIQEIRDLAEGRTSAVKLGEKWGAGVMAGFGPQIDKALASFNLDKLRALRRSLDDVIAGFQEAGLEVPAAMQQAADRLHRSTERMGAALHRIRGEVEAFGNTWGQTLSEIRQRTDRNMADIAQSLGKHSRRGRQAISDNFFAAMQAIKNSIDDGVIAERKGFAEMDRLLIKALRSYGIKKPAEFLKISKTKAGIAAANVKAGVGSPGLQRGGFIDMGKSSGDSVGAMLERGEYVLNRKAVQSIGKRALDAVNFTAAPRFAAGGIVGLGQQLQREGYEVGEHPAFGGVAPVHVAGSYHYRGQAIDVNDDAAPFASGSGEPGSLDRLYARLKKMSGVVELLWRVANHYDHLHVAMSGKGGALPGGAMGMAAKVTLPRASSDFPLGAVAASAVNVGAMAREQQVEAKLRQTAFGGQTAPEFGGGVLSRGQMRQLMRSVGLPDIFGYIAEAESGLNPRAYNPSGASGLWQIMMPLHQALVQRAGGNVFDPVTNAKVAKMLYGQSGLSPWAASQAGWGGHQGQPYQKGGIIGMQGGGQIPTVSLPGGGTFYAPPILDVISGIPELEVIGPGGTGGGGPGGGGSGASTLPDLAKFLKNVWGTKKGSERAGLLSRFTDQIKKFGLPKDKADRIATLTEDIANYGEWASNAGTISEEGKPPKQFHGNTELGHLKTQLLRMYDLRNALIEGQEVIDRKRRELQAFLVKAKDHLDKVVKAIKDAEKEKGEIQKRIKAIRDQREKDREDVPRWEEKLKAELRRKPKDRNPNRIKDLREKIWQARARVEDAPKRIDDLQKKVDRINDRQKIRAWVKDTGLGGDGIIATVGDAESGRIGELITQFGEYGDSLRTLQGAGSPMEKLYGAAAVNQEFGGDILATRQRIVELSKVLEPEKRDPLSIAGLLEFAQAVHLGAFGPGIPRFAAGGLHSGGMALVGERGPEIATLPSGTRIHSNQESQQMLGGDQYFDIYIGGEKIAEHVRAQLRHADSQGLNRWRAGVTAR